MDLFFNIHKVRYVLLDELFKQVEIDDIGKDVNVFINLENVLLKMCNQKTLEEISVDAVDSVFKLISNVVNLAAHYRLYFTKLGIKSKIYFYIQYPKTNYKNRKINEFYRRTYDHMMFNNVNNHKLEYIVVESLKFLKIIIEYIEGVYIIQSDDIESSLVPKIIIDDSKHSFIVTTSLYDFQYISDKTHIIYPKLEKSKILTTKNIMDFIISSNHIKTEYNVSYSALPFIIAMSGDKYRNIENIKGIGIGTTLKLLDRAIKENMITENTKSKEFYINIIDKRYQKKIKDNFKCCSVEQQFNQLNEKDLFKIKSQIVDKFDNDSLKTLNDTWFLKYPLYLVELTSQPVPVRKKIIF